MRRFILYWKIDGQEKSVEGVIFSSGRVAVERYPFSRDREDVWGYADITSLLTDIGDYPLTVQYFDPYVEPQSEEE